MYFYVSEMLTYTLVLTFFYIASYLIVTTAQNLRNMVKVTTSVLFYIIKYPPIIAFIWNLN